MSRTGIPRIDPDDPNGARALERLATSRVIWMTTVGGDGTPQSSPVWFLWDGGTFLVYSLESKRVGNLARHPRVGLHLDGNGLGGDIVVVEGSARIDRTLRGVPDNPDYLAKYGSIMAEREWTPEWFGGRYSVPIVIEPTRFRFW